MKYPNVHVEEHPQLTLLGRAGDAIFKEEGGKARSDFLNDIVSKKHGSFNAVLDKIREYVNVE